MNPLKSHKCFEGKTEFWSHPSAVTKTHMKFSTFIPEGEIRGCIIWLSGITCTEENFITKAGAQKYLAKNQLMLIAPDTSPRGLNLPGEHDAYDFGSGASFYVNATVLPYSTHYQMYDYIVNELYLLIETEFNVNKISIMGHSMGGHGALIMGLKNPEKFKSVSAFSPIVNPTKGPWGVKALTGYLGSDQNAWKDYDATELVLNGKTHPAKILIHQGTHDEFLTRELHTMNFVDAVQDKGQVHEVVFADGYDHSYYFISTYIEVHILHHASYLR